MSKYLIVCLLSLFILKNGINKKELSLNNQNSSFLLANTFPDFNSLNTKIRDGRISKQEAIKQIQILLPQIKKYNNRNSGKNIDNTIFTFPVQGYSSRAIGGTNGSGYIASGYNYFDGNKHGGHPAHDIFITDKDQDCVDDISKKPVNVLSMTSGIVIATETTWDSTSNLRGGKYIWIYEPISNSFYYYAHNNKIFVKPGNIVNTGDTIATVGRTGLNAFKKRSPTHLHIMQLKVDSTYNLKPVNCYNTLTRIKH
jgi:murein DD-endopeptidase MepM/ murein hydrolase activator NlpD